MSSVTPAPNRSAVAPAAAPAGTPGRRPAAPAGGLARRDARAAPDAERRAPPSAAAPLDADAAYLAWATRDARFDGRLFVGVRTTGVYRAIGRCAGGDTPAT